VPFYVIPGTCPYKVKHTPSKIKEPWPSRATKDLNDYSISDSPEHYLKLYQFLCMALLSTGYTQVIDQSASGSPVKINAWSHYAAWLAYLFL
jgi:hypothetical protein